MEPVCVHRDGPRARAERLVLLKRRYELLEAVSEGSGQHGKKEKNGCCPSFASMREKGRERVGTATQQFESGRKRS